MKQRNEREELAIKGLMETLVTMGFEWREKGVSVSPSLIVYYNEAKKHDFTIVSCFVTVDEIEKHFSSQIDKFSKTNIANFLKQLNDNAEKFSKVIATERKALRIKKIAQLKKEINLLGEN